MVFFYPQEQRFSRCRNRRNLKKGKAGNATASYARKVQEAPSCATTVRGEALATASPATATTRRAD